MPFTQTVLLLQFDFKAIKRHRVQQSSEEQNSDQGRLVFAFLHRRAQLESAQLSFINKKLFRVLLIRLRLAQCFSNLT